MQVPTKVGWQDESSYSRDETVRVPRVWVLYAPHITIKIHHARHDKANWFLSCHTINFSDWCLETSDENLAKERALIDLKKLLYGFAQEVEDVQAQEALAKSTPAL